jgi:PIN domain nuclease of toxin-antitoxin system
VGSYEVILLDTHIWIWWVQGDPLLSSSQGQLIKSNEATGLGVSVIPCWEVATLVEVGRLTLPCPIKEWIDQALAYPGIQLIDLTPRIAWSPRSYQEHFTRILPIKSLLPRLVSSAVR